MAKKDRKDERVEFSGFMGEGTNFKGILGFNGTFRIDSEFEGEIVTSDTLIIGESAVISAEITVGTIYISGKVIGNINAKERVEINSTGEVYGNIKTPILVIDEGVIFEGNCAMKKVEEKEKNKEKKLAVVPNV
ncbi:MAG: bactofilin family protein [bacterium]